MHALIIEDERMAQAQLLRLLASGFPEIQVVKICDSVSSSIEYLSTSPEIDIIFMDVELSDGDCFEIIRQTAVKSPVIMTTAYDSYAIKAFEAGSIDYLLKPIDSRKLERAVSRCRERSIASDNIKKLLSVIDNPKKQYKERFIIHSGERIIPVKLDEAALFFSEDKANYILLNSGERYIIDSTMDALEANIDPEKFFRVSRGCIIGRQAVKQVSKVQGGRLIITSEPHTSFEITVSRARVDDFCSWLE